MCLIYIYFFLLLNVNLWIWWGGEGEGFIDFFQSLFMVSVGHFYANLVVLSLFLPTP